MKSIGISLIIVIGLSVLIGCTKEGKQGEPGINGQDGNADVKVTFLNVTASNQWGWNSSISAREAIFSGVNNLNNDVVSYGGVFLYQDLGGVYAQLPLSYTYSNKIEQDYFLYGVNSIQITIQNDDGSDPISQIPIPTRYKLVTIPSSARLANPNVDYSNYEEVREIFSLKD